MKPSSCSRNVAINISKRFYRETNEQKLIPNVGDSLAKGLSHMHIVNKSSNRENLGVVDYSAIKVYIFVSSTTGCIAPLGMESKSITDDQLSASSQLGSNYSAVQARLHFKADGNKAGGWSALKNDLNQWLQVDFGSYTRVTRVATQGRNAYNEWVAKYRLQYSDDGIRFQFYKDVGDNSAKVYVRL